MTPPGDFTDPWERYSHPWVWCPSGEHRSPPLADHHEAGDWHDAHARDCHPAAAAA